MNILLDIFNFLLLVSIVGISYAFKRNYPKEINDVVGYRTKRSMKSQANWLEANKYSSSLIFKISWIAAGCQLVLYISFGGQVSLFVTVGLWILLLLWVIFKTERRLKRLDSSD